MKKKKSGGRRAGQSAKSHTSVHEDVAGVWQKLDPAEQQKLLAQKITPETLELWRHAEAAGKGDFKPEVQFVAMWLGELADYYKWVLQSDRRTLEANRRKIEIPLPVLPGDPMQAKLVEEAPIDPDRRQFNHLEKKLLIRCGHAAIWAMRGNWSPALHLLSVLIQAAIDNDVDFFHELARRVKACNPQTGVTLRSPASPVLSALLSLKECYFEEHCQPESIDRFYARETPLLVPVLKCPPGKRPPLTVPQIAEWVRAWANVKMSDRSLIRHADIMGIPRVRGRGRLKVGT